MLNREQNHFLKLFFHFLQSTDILPFDTGNFNMSLSQRCRVNGTHSKFEVILSDSHSLKYLGINFLSLDINNIHFLSNTLQGSLGTQRSNISSNKAMSILSNSLKINILGEFHILSMYSQYFKSPNLIRHSNINFSIKSTKSSQSWID